MNRSRIYYLEVKMTDLNYDKIDNPEDKTQGNEEVKNSSIKSG